MMTFFCVAHVKEIEKAVCFYASYCCRSIMPLSNPVKRKLAHTRVVTCKGYEREDGLWDIEGHMVDTKPFAFPNKDRGGEIKADEPLHGMWIRLTIDLQMNIHEAEGCIDFAPFNHCDSISPKISQLKGWNIGPGWTRKLKDLMGGTRGCTHLTELLGPMATTAYQTMVSARAEYGKVDTKVQKEAPSFLNKCYSLSVNSPVVKEHWPQFHVPPEDINGT